MDTNMENNVDHLVNNCNDQELKAKIPALPEGKTKHFFVSYTNLDKQRVYSVIEAVEKRFGLQCVLDERDFQGGKDITVNIREGMMSSLKVLLFLTPNFLASGWCKYETDVAFISSMGCGYSCIVPVLLEQCEIPPTLLTLTYIDATIPGLDVPAKIAASLSRPASGDGLFSLNIRAFNRQYENGYCFIIPAVRDNLSVIRPAKYRFSVDNNLIEKLKENMVEVPEHLLQTAVDIVNKSGIMSSYDYLSRCKNFLWVFLLIPLLTLITAVVNNSSLLGTATRGRGSQLSGDDGYIISLLIFILPAITFIQILVCFLPTFCHRKQRDLSLQRQLWEKVGKECIENNLIILFTGRRNKKPSEHLVGTMKSKKITPTNRTLTLEEFADLLIGRHLEQSFHIMADDFEYLPDAPYNRHNVKKGKMCICQQLEQDL